MIWTTLSTRRCSSTSARLSKREQTHFEQAVGQLERFVDDKVLVCRRERASVAEKLHSARERRDTVVGFSARERVRGGDRSPGEQGSCARTPYRGIGLQGGRGLSKMAKRISRASLPGSVGDPAVPGGVPDRAGETEDIVIKLLHTADWHLGRRFPSFPEEAQKKLSRARMDVVARILEVARRNRVDAVLCAGDLFDDPTPAADFWEGLAQDVSRSRSSRLIPPSSWFRAIMIRLPPNRSGLRVTRFESDLPHWVHVVDQDNFTCDLASDVVLYASPCRSKAGENDLAMALPAREPGDMRLRIGCVHGSTFDIDGYQTNFPICRDAGVQRGLDYLAIGDTHSFRDVTESLPVPTVYPGAPEPTNFDEPGAGCVALVALFRHGSRRPARMRRSGLRSGGGSTGDAASVNELRTLADYPGPRTPCRQVAPGHDRIAGRGERGRTHRARAPGHRRRPRPRRRPARGPHQPEAATRFGRGSSRTICRRWSGTLSRGWTN